MPTYIPIVRPGPNEKDALNRFSGGLGRFSEIETWDAELFPMLEPVSRDDEDEFSEYTDVANRLMVDFPRYLSTRSTKFDELDDFLSNYDEDPNEFFEENADQIDVPVASQSTPDLLDYGELLPILADLQDDYSSVGVRMFVDGAELTDEQLSDLDNIAEQLRPPDNVLMDVIQIGGWEGRLKENLKTIRDKTPVSTQTFVLNAFEPRVSDVAHNYGPVVSSDLSLDGFGDFVLEARYPPSGGGADDPDRIIRHYDEYGFEVENFRADSYDDAYEALEDSDYFDPDHCNFCRAMGDPVRRTEGHNFWKVNRMGHYIHSILDEILEMIEEHDAEDLDMDGHDDLEKRSGEDGN